MFERGGGVEEDKHPYDKTCRQCNVMSGISQHRYTGKCSLYAMLAMWGIIFVNNQTLGTLLLPFKI